MAVDQRITTRRKLVERLAVKLDEATMGQVSNNDVRRLIDNFEMVLAYLRAMEEYPADVPRYNPVTAVRPGHLSDDLLDAFSGDDTRGNLPADDLAKIVTHLKKCSFCTARVEFFKTLLVVGQHVRPANPNERHTPCFDITPSSPTALNAGLGISAGGYRDDQ